MYGALKGAKGALQRKKKVEDPRPDNFIFRLHYQYTFGILIIAATLNKSYEYVDSKGSDIQCMTDKGIQVGEKYMNRYCFFSSTFTLPKHYNGTKGQDVLYPGVGPHDKEQDEEVYHNYYMWVPYMLGFQAAMFYLPHWIWKQLESGRLERIIAGLNNADCNEKDAKIGQLAKYMNERLRDQYDHKVWAAKFYFCEFLNFVNIVFQLCITDSFLGKQFRSYGWRAAFWSSFDNEGMDPMEEVFPRMTKCVFHKFGGSGTIQNFDALCVLGMNIINEKIYVFLWFWFVALAVLTAVNLVFRLVTLLLPQVRSKLVMLEEFGFRHSRGQSGQVERVLAALTYPDWLILYYLAQCMEKKNFSLLVSKMCERVSEDTHIDEDEKNSTGVENNGTLPSKDSLKNFLKTSV